MEHEIEEVPFDEQRLRDADPDLFNLLKIILL